MLRVFFGNLIFDIIARILRASHLKLTPNYRVMVQDKSCLKRDKPTLEQY